MVTNKELRRLYDDFNARHFAGRLPGNVELRFAIKTCEKRFSVRGYELYKSAVSRAEKAEAENESLRSEAAENARIIGMSGSREAKLESEVGSHKAAVYLSDAAARPSKAEESTRELLSSPEEIEAVVKGLADTAAGHTKTLEEIDNE